MMSRTYSELITIPDFIDRYRYLRIGGQVGELTFNGHRYLNQLFYRSEEWKAIRKFVIQRDSSIFGMDACYDLAHRDRPIGGRIYIHHIEPITIEDINNRSAKLLDPENLVCVSFDTHQAIHYGDETFLRINEEIERKPFDTCPWRTQ